VASQAEVDLVVNATRTLPQLERDLDRVLNAAQADMSDLDVNAVLRSTQSLNDIERDLDRIIRQAEDDADPVVIQAAMRQRDEIRRLQGDLNAVVTAVNRDGSADALTVLTALNVPDSIADLDDDVRTVVRAVNAVAPDIDIDVDVDRNAVRTLLRTLATTTTTIGGVTAGVAGLSYALGSLAPLLASTAVSIQNILPASAIATQGILSVALAAGTLKLGMMGVSDAVKDAFDPGTKAEDLEKTLQKLAPNARKFVVELAGMKSEFKKLQLGVQNRLFKNFDKAVKGLGDEVLPRVGKALNQTATTFNKMGLGVAQAAVKLSRDGTLGKALDGATKGLQNLTKIPGQATTAFGQLAAAAAPAFDRVTKAVAKAATKWSGKIDDAFKDGSLEKAIDRAVSAVAQLGRVFGNVFSGIGNVIRAVGTEGDGLFGTLERVTQAFEDLTKDADVQAGLKALGETAALVSKTVLPLLGEAIKIVGRTLVSLQGPIQEVVTILGDALGEALKALGPALVAAGRAFGDLLRALGPVITLAGTLVANLLPALNPLLSGLGDIFRSAAPLVQEVATVLSSLFLPVIQQLPGILEQIVPVFSDFAATVLPQLTEQLEFAAPTLADLGLQIADLAVAVAPLVVQILELATVLAAQLIPIINGAVMGTLVLLTGALTGLGQLVEDYLIPTMGLFVSFLNGDVFDATTSAGQTVRKFRDDARAAIGDFVDSAQERFGRYAQAAKTKFTEAKDSALNAVSDMVSDAIDYLSDLPGRAANALGDLGHVLFSAGASLIGGFIDGIQSKIGAVTSTLSNLTAKLPDWKGPAELDARILAPSGELLIDGLIAGIQRAVPRVRSELQGLTGQLPGFGPQLAGVTAPAAAAFAPVVYVSIGNEAVDQYVTVRADQVYDQRARTEAQGVRF
jgi:phage-related protein